MQLKLFIVPVKNLSVSEAEMNVFLRSHRVLAVRKEFVSDGENSFWSFCVEYLESAPAGIAPPVLALLGGHPVSHHLVELIQEIREERRPAARVERSRLQPPRHHEILDGQHRGQGIAQTRQEAIHEGGYQEGLQKRFNERPFRRCEADVRLGKRP